MLGMNALKMGIFSRAKPLPLSHRIRSSHDPPDHLLLSGGAEARRTGGGDVLSELSADGREAHRRHREGPQPPPSAESLHRRPLRQGESLVRCLCCVGGTGSLFFCAVALSFRNILNPFRNEFLVKSLRNAPRAISSLSGATDKSEQGKSITAHEFWSKDRNAFQLEFKFTLTVVVE